MSVWFRHYSDNSVWFGGTLKELSIDGVAAPAILRPHETVISTVATVTSIFPKM
jgi:hypothetical protein